jgi:hypothetical protein
MRMMMWKRVGAWFICIPLNLSIQARGNFEKGQTRTVLSRQHTRFIGECWKMWSTISRRIRHWCPQLPSRKPIVIYDRSQVSAALQSRRSFDNLESPVEMLRIQWCNSRSFVSLPEESAIRSVTEGWNPNELTTNILRIWGITIKWPLGTFSYDFLYPQIFSYDFSVTNLFFSSSHAHKSSLLISRSPAFSSRISCSHTFPYDFSLTHLLLWFLTHKSSLMISHSRIFSYDFSVTNLLFYNFMLTPISLWFLSDQSSLLISHSQRPTQVENFLWAGFDWILRRGEQEGACQSIHLFLFRKFRECGLNGRWLFISIFFFFFVINNLHFWKVQEFPSSLERARKPLISKNETLRSLSR